MGKGKVLVTGASGFIGGTISLDLRKRGYDVVAVGGRKPCPPVFDREGIGYVNAFLEDPNAISALVAEVSPAFIIHAAAMADSAACERDQIGARAANVTATENVVKAAEQNGSRLAYISTDWVFDGAEAPEGGFRESDMPVQKTVYGTTKREGERAVERLGDRAAIVRIALAYGAPFEGKQGFLGW